MDTEASFLQVLTAVNFGIMIRLAILEFCCENLKELARLTVKELDKSIGNLHKCFANTTQGRVYLNATKCILLHSIRLHFQDCLNCDAGLETATITALVYGYIQTMRTNYLKAEES